MKRNIFWLFAAIIILAGCVTPQPRTVIVDRDARVEIRPGGVLALEIARREGPYQAVSGIRGVRLDPTDVIITFRNERLGERIRPGTEVNWISNLPRGLTARVREAERGSSRVVLVIEGIPQITLNDAMHFNIPGTDLQRGESFAFISEEAKFEILLGSLNLSEHTSTLSPALNYTLLSGSVGTEIPVFDFRVNLIETSLLEAIETETPVDWVVNSPAGLDISVQPAARGATTLFLTVRGNPQEARNEAVQVVIPGHILGDVTNFHVPNEIIVWDIIGGSINAILVNGSVDSEIISKDLSLMLLGTSFSEDMVPGTVVSGWISNLPAGLTARVRRVRANESTGVITIAGIPRATSTDVIEISIPSNLVSNEAQINFMSNVDARFAINDNTVTVTVNEIASGSSNPNWIGPQVGPLNIPTLPPVKDFQGVGIVTVRTTAVQRLGADNQYHWSGQTVNYGLLVEEAQRIGAHAIINIVVDFTDQIERNEVVRELAWEHEWSQNELDRMARGILREVRTEAGRFSVEVSHVITRSYIGSALAIRFIDGFDFLHSGD